MRFLLAQNLLYYPNVGGANTANRQVLEALVTHGHSCRAISLSHTVQSSSTPATAADALRKAGATHFIHSRDRSKYELNGVEVISVPKAAQLAPELLSNLESYQPDWTIVSSEDTCYSLLRVATHDQRPTIYFARTPILLPCGPSAVFPSSAATQNLARITHVLSVSRFLQEYLSEWAHIRSTVIPLAFYGHVKRAERKLCNRFITIVNPCSIKGLSVFLQIVKALPHHDFAAVPSWGTTNADLDLLKQLPNVTILPSTQDIDDVFRVTSLLLVPSLWVEGRGEIATQAMLRGIPVLASNVGGLTEAKGNVPYNIPVVPIDRYEPLADEKGLPVPTVPSQDPAPWVAAIRLLTAHTKHYNELSCQSLRAARAIADEANILHLLRTLQST